MLETYSTEVKTLLKLGAEAMARKNFELAVEHYSEVCHLSNLEKGHDDPDCMFLYGKALFENAVANSDVLGAKKNQETSPEKEKEDQQQVFNEQLAEEEDEDEERKQTKPEQKDERGEDDDSDDEEVAADEEGQEEDEDEDDFTLAWEILDLTRVLYETALLESIKVEHLPAETPYFSSDKLSDIESQLSQNKSLNFQKKLADTFDLLGELSLETENFIQATSDFKQMLDIKTKLYPFHTGQVTEAYYKLSLAWEFNSAEDQAIANAITAMESAIKSIATRAVLAKQNQTEEIDADLIFEMKARLEDLKSGDLKIKQEKDRIMKGLMGELSQGSNTIAAEDSVTPIKINDLSSVVKKRKAPSSGKLVKKVKK